jgi:hypothetical protein
MLAGWQTTAHMRTNSVRSDLEMALLRGEVQSGAIYNHNRRAQSAFGAYATKTRG